MDAPDPETLCQRCGRCCFFKERIGDTWYIGDTPCPYLCLKTQLCQVYAARASVPWCVNPLELMSKSPLPQDCPLAVAFGGPEYVGAKTKG